MRPAMEISAMAFGEEEDEGSNVWTEHLTEELPALMERIILAILIDCLEVSSELSKVVALSGLLSLSGQSDESSLPN